MDMQSVIEDLAEEAERLVADQVWILSPAERTAAAKAAADLHAAVGPSPSQQTLTTVDRLEHLREALATVAIALAHVHGRLAWFLGAAATAFTPVLHWRALPAEEGATFGAVQPTPLEYAEAEDAVRRLQRALTSIATA
ncbi:hypothetical protein GCM10010230_25160 [Streptomyces narbonensis]|uniref:hypothetical protein n=1 Tax=Streptomyces narbonensis TaxID=67333 RepID=UPI001674DDEB|nr:hypothetical protein [Streptomyces narbonensis]GGV99321.1 hypothetical protein GCM10010230_25160 [Streptomyces narbonensis]